MSIMHCPTKLCSLVNVPGGLGDVLRANSMEADSIQLAVRPSQRKYECSRKSDYKDLVMGDPRDRNSRQPWAAHPCHLNNSEGRGG